MFRVVLSFEAPDDETVVLDDHQEALYRAYRVACEEGTIKEQERAYEALLDTFYDQPFYEYIEDIFRPKYLQRQDEEEN